MLPNANGLADYAAGDPDGVEIHGEEVEGRALPFPQPSAWSGWPAEWATPSWASGQSNKLIDVAWNCLDLNASVLASMPVYRMSNGRVSDSVPWMFNPDPDVYSSWEEFAKQLFWDYQLGEAFVLPMTTYGDGYPRTFRVIPPWLVNVEFKNGRRSYSVGGNPANEILHIRYQSTTTDSRGHGPLEMAAPRMVTAGLLMRYAQTLAETGGVPLYWLGVDRRLNESEASDLLDRWVESRKRRAGEPALVSGGASLNQANTMSATDMALLELAQFNESKIAVALGVPPFLAGLPSGGDSMTYANVAQLFEFHDRSSLRPKATAVMKALSRWALPHGQSIELNRDEYSRPSLKDRAEAYKTLNEIRDEHDRPAMTVEEIRDMERLHGEPDNDRATPTATSAALSLTGGNS